MEAGRLARITLGFILGPAIGLLLLGLSWCAVLGLTRAGSFGSCFAEGSMVYLAIGVGAVFAYPAALVFGIPLFLIFRRRGWLGWRQVGLAGAGVGALSILAVALYLGSFSGAAGYLLLTGSVGFVSALVFWVIAVWTPPA